jgi:hypothetical protein
VARRRADLGGELRKPVRPRVDLLGRTDDRAVVQRELVLRPVRRDDGVTGRGVAHAEKADREKPITFTSDDGEVNYEKRTGVLKGTGFMVDDMRWAWIGAICLYMLWGIAAIAWEFPGFTGPAASVSSAVQAMKISVRSRKSPA